MMDEWFNIIGELTMSKNVLTENSQVQHFMKNKEADQRWGGGFLGSRVHKNGFFILKAVRL